MIDPYRMVIVNFASLVFLLLGLFVYKFIYPKKNPNLFILLIILSLLPLISLLRAGTYESGDLTYNVYNLMEFTRSIFEGHILPQWAGLSNATYGYPLFIFLYPLPYIIGFLFHSLGFSFIASMKLFVAFSFIASGITMYLWVREELGKTSAFVASVFYLYAPYHLVDTHFRVSTGEIASFAIIPLAFFSVKKFLDKRRLRWLLLLSFSLALLILANQAIALTAFAFLGMYTLFSWSTTQSKKIGDLLGCFSAFTLSLLLSAFYWIPALMLTSYTHQAEFVRRISFIGWEELLYSPYRFGFLFQGSNGELSFVIGYVQLFVIIFLCFLILKGALGKSLKARSLFFIISILSFCFLMTSYSKFVWDNISILRNFQFTFRLLLLVAVSTSFLAGILALKLNKVLIILLCLAVVFQSILNWGNRRTIPSYDDTTLRSQLPVNTGIIAGFHPAVPKWVDFENPWFLQIPKKHVEILKGKATVREVERTSTRHKYVISSKSPIYIKENTTYFPGWEARLDGEKIKMDYRNAKHPGVITLKLPSGIHLLELEFKDTPVVKTAKLITAISTVTLVFFILARKKLRFLPKL